MAKSARMIMIVFVWAAFLGIIVTAAHAAANEIGRDSRFIAYDDGTVWDTKTNLMWASRDHGSELIWPEARSYCEKYNAGGYTDWRLPTSAELEGLYDDSIDRNYRLTKLIKLTWGSIWASDQEGSYYRVFNFKKGGTFRGVSPVHRALPVRAV